MPFIDKFISLFRGQQHVPQKQLLPEIIRYDEDVNDHWLVLGELGDGAFGKVEKVVNKHDQTVFAASKVIEIEDGEELKDFIIEIEILVGCKHENIVGLLDCFYAENRLSIMLEFCAGGAVDGIMLELEKPLMEPQIAYITKYVCKALVFLHDNGVIHRDLKAGNILLTSSAVVKLADFGVSAIMKDKCLKRNTFIGTPYWMAPEVMACETFNDQPYDCRADIWSFGITLIEMAQMEPPNSEVSPMRVLIKVQKSEPPKLCDPGRWSMFFNDFLSRCLVKNPSERCCAADLLTHPFIENGNDRKSIEQLLLEVNADVKEEIIEEDRQSCDESVADSEDAENITAEDAESVDRIVESDESNAANKSKKRAAPLPPQISPQVLEKKDGTTPIEIREPDEKSEKGEAIVRAEPVISGAVINIEGKRDKSSEREEAMEILDDLFTVLDNQDHVSDGNKDSPSEDGTPKHSTHKTEITVASCESINVRHEAEEQAATDAIPRPQSSTGSLKEIFENGAVYMEPPADGIHRATPSRTIHDICEQARKESQRLQASEVTDFTTSAEHLSVSKTEDDNCPKPLNWRVNEDKEDEFDVRDIRDRFETCGKNAEEPIIHSVRSPISIPEGLVKRNREIVEVDQLTARAKDGAVAIREQRKKDDANIFSQADVSKIAARFTVKPPSEYQESTTVQIRGTRSSNNKLHENRPTSLQSTRESAVPPAAPLTKSASCTTDQISINLQISTNPDQPSHGTLTRRKPKALSTEEISSKPVSYFGADTIKKTSKTTAKPLLMPPPEPPVDYNEPPTNKSNSAVKIKYVLSTVPGSNVLPRAKAASNSAIGNRKATHRQTVTKKTRTYVVDGVEVTSTTLHVLGAKQDFELRKQEMQDLKRMQREEARQHKELLERTELMKEQLHRKFGQEQLNLHKSYDAEIENLARTQKRQMEETERSQEDEMRQTSKRLRVEQERELRAFRDRQKQEVKILKQEIEFLPKAQRKDRWRDAKEEIERRHAAEEGKFTEELEQTHDIMMNRLRQNHLERMSMLERQFLEQKHQLERSRESADWELEERRIIERQQLLKQALKDQFFLQRSNMLARHQKELDHVRKINMTNEEELVRALALDRKKLPKMLRAESKTRTIMFKESLRINTQGENVSEWSERMRRFDEQEKIRIRNAMEDHERKCKKRLTAAREQNAETVKELEEIQNEKRKMLLETEQSKLAQFDGECINVIQTWKEGLPKRKEVLEDRFGRELENQERFYHGDLPT
uniref:Protein kinase domain-containing protein n=1 Tax=Steinernema glaseri TaxID=37863 RepID=A0A1I7ZIZ5_9BILA